MKVCKTCQKEKDDSCFKNHRKCCYDCHLQWRRDRSKQYSKEHKDYLSKNNKKWREEKREYVKAYQAEYRLKNKEKIKLDKFNYEKKRIKTDPIYAMRRRMHAFISKRFKNLNTSKRERTSKIIGCTYKFLYEYLGPKPDGDYHLDHICPCAQAQSEEEFIKLQHYTNFRWLKSEENLLKSNSWTLEGEEMCRKLLGRDWIHGENL